jgi:DNA-binding transcriptional ArsR family regulator
MSPDSDLNPTDEEILEVLASGNRETTSTLASKLDQNNAYISNRLKKLRDNGYIERTYNDGAIGPHQITADGRALLGGGAVDTFPRLSPHMTERRFDILDRVGTLGPATKHSIPTTEEDAALIVTIVESLLASGLLVELELDLHGTEVAGSQKVTAIGISELGERVLQSRGAWEDGGDKALAAALDRDDLL